MCGKLDVKKPPLNVQRDTAAAVGSIGYNYHDVSIGRYESQYVTIIVGSRQAE